MTRVGLPGAALQADGWDLPADRAHYLVRVRRLKAGDGVRVFDGAGHEVDAVLVAPEADGAPWRLARAGAVEKGRRAAPLTLVYGLPKGDKLDRVARQITELGAARLILLDCARSVVKLAGPRAAKRRDRVLRIVDEAARQCARADTPAVIGPVSLDAALAATADETRWVLHPGADGRVTPLDAAPCAPPLALFVGPEGGFAPAELHALDGAGAHRIALDCPVLRTETAAPVAVALALYRMGGL